VAGVILDLRYNGGGSLQDAVEMGGLFVPSGPMVQVKPGRGPAQALDDKDPQVQYGGPLVVLVNKYSASASEILAAAMQDYRRGIVMGSTTYGKGTVQQVFDLDRAVSAEFKGLMPLGSLKLTLQKFYRVNGGSTQFKGVVPDIVLPDALASFAKGEQEMEYPLKWDEIQPARYRPWNDAPAVDKLRASSKARVASNPSFKMLDDISQRMRKRKDETVVSLKLTAYRAEQQQAKAEADKYEETQKSTTDLVFAPLAADVRALGGDTVKVNRRSRFTKGLKKDIVIGEAVAVLQDELKR
jgi:carboxyl-terminal processing protease